MKRMLLCCMLIICIILLCVGCQPTPDIPAVVNKNDGKLEEIINTTPEVTPQETKQTLNIEPWKETYTLPTVVCTIEPEIVLPENNIFPVLKIQQSGFTADMANGLLAHFTKDAVGVRETSDTKEELMEKLIIAKKGAYVLDDDGGRWESYEGQEDDIKRLEDKIKNVPEETFDKISQESVTFPFKQTYLMADNSKRYISSDDSRFMFYDTKSSIVQPESWLLAGEAIPGEPKGTTLKNVKISEEEATKVMQDIMDDLGISDFGIADKSKARMVNGNTCAILSEGWLFTLARTYGNYIPIDFLTYRSGGPVELLTEDFMPRWWPESITIYVDETGVRSFSWTNRKEITQEVNANVSILSFEEIKTKIKDSIKLGLSWTEADKNNSTKSEILITKMTLTGVMVPIKDEPDYQYILPAWVVFFQKTDDSYVYVFAVNAIDGSSIDLSMRKKELD